jgi:hypothetical protein
MPIFNKSITPPKKLTYLAVNEQDDLHLAVPLISGSSIGLDNTCQTGRALKDFFNNQNDVKSARYQLDEYKKYLYVQQSFLIFREENDRASQSKIITKQITQIDKLLVGLTSLKNIMNMDFKNNPLIDGKTQLSLKETNLLSASLRPLNLDSMGNPKYPSFSIDRGEGNNFTDLQSSYNDILRNFNNQSCFAKSLRAGLRAFSFESNYFIFDAARANLFKISFDKDNDQIKSKTTIGALEVDGDFKLEYLTSQDINEIEFDENSKDFCKNNLHKINFILDKIFTKLQLSLSQNKIVSADESNKIINELKSNKTSLKDIIQALRAYGDINDQTDVESFFEPILSSAKDKITAPNPLYSQNVALSDSEKEAIASKMDLSIKFQFFLAQINIYLINAAKFEEGKETNFGKILDAAKTLQDSFIAIISKENFQESKVEEEIFNFFEKNFKSFNLAHDSNQIFKFGDDEKKAIIKSFVDEFNTVKDSAHFDNFWFLRPKIDGKAFSYGGNICIDFNSLAAIHLNQYQAVNYSSNQYLTCNADGIEPVNIKQDSGSIEVADDNLWEMATKELEKKTKDSFKYVLAFLKFKDDSGKYFFENKNDELQTLCSGSPSTKKALILLANQEFQGDTGLLSKFLEIVDPTQKQIILTKDQLRALYTTFAADERPEIYQDAHDKLKPIKGFETPDDIKKILENLLDQEYFNHHKVKNPKPVAFSRHQAWQFCPENPPTQPIDNISITINSSSSAYISVNKDQHKQLKDFLDHIIYTNKNKLYIPNDITIGGHLRNASKKIFEYCSKQNPRWEQEFIAAYNQNTPVNIALNDAGSTLQKYKMKKALELCGIDIPNVEDIGFSGNNGYVIKFQYNRPIEIIEEIIYPNFCLTKPASQLLYNLAEKICSPAIFNEIKEIPYHKNKTKLRLVLKALGINYFGLLDYNTKEEFNIKVDPEFEKFFKILNSTNDIETIKGEYKKLIPCLVGLEEKLLFSELKSEEFTADELKEIGNIEKIKMKSTIEIQKLAACKYENSLPKQSLESKIKIYCPDRILEAFQELLKDKKEILGSTIKNPYDDSGIIIPDDHKDLTAYHLHILARNEGYNIDGIMNVKLYEGLLDTNEIAKLRCLVKASNLVSVTSAKAYGGYPKGNPIIKLIQPEKVIIIDQSGLQWQGDHRNSGGLFFYPDDDDQNKKNLSGGDYDKYKKWQEDMFGVMYQRQRPKEISENSMNVIWKGVKGKIDLDQLAFGIKEEFLQAFSSAVNSSDLLDEDERIYFKFLKAGMGFFADGIGAQDTNTDESRGIRKARLEGIRDALKELKARIPKATLLDEKGKIFKKVKVVELPFSASDGDQTLHTEIRNLVESLGLIYQKPTIDDAIKRNPAFADHIIATTNTGDPHAFAGNEGGYQSVDAAISSNLENSNCLNPLINNNFGINTPEITIKSSQKAIIDFEETEKSFNNLNCKIFTPTLNFQGIKYQDERFSFISYDASKTKDEVFNIITFGLTEAKKDLEQEQTPIPAKFFLAVMQISSYNQGVGSMKEDDLKAQLRELLDDSYEDNYPKLAIKFSAQFQKKMMKELLTSRQLETNKLNPTAMRLFRASTDENIEKFFNLITTAEEAKNFSELLQNNYKKLSALTPSKNHKIILTSATELSTKARASAEL